MPESTKPPKFDRVGYLRTIANTMELEDGMKAVLNCLALYCGENLSVRRQDFTQEKVQQRTGLGEFAVRKAFARLERTGLIRQIDSPYPKERAKYWQLPTEEQLAQYEPSQTA